MEERRSGCDRTSQVTEPVQLGGLTAPAERKVRLFLGGGHVWQEQSGPVTVRIQIDPIPEPEIAEGETGAEGDAGEERGGA